MNQLNESNFFFCYDKRIMKYLRYDKGFKFITKAIHEKSGSPFWLFHITPELDQALKEIK